MNTIHEHLESYEDLTRLETRGSVGAPVDIQSVATSGIGIVLPLHVLLLGALSIGTFAAVASRNPDWDRIQAVQYESGSGYSDTVAVPFALGSTVRITTKPRQLDFAPVDPSRHHLPEFLHRSVSVQLQELSVDLPTAVPTFDVEESQPAPVRAVPLPPQNLTIK
jgi:hypothetical protein